jgi:hypothetical protein
MTPRLGRYTIFRSVGSGLTVVQFLLDDFFLTRLSRMLIEGKPFFVIALRLLTQGRAAAS